jgi:NADH-quinone oxidoreductase subunit E
MKKEECELMAGRNNNNGGSATNNHDAVGRLHMVHELDVNVQDITDSIIDRHGCRKSAVIQMLFDIQDEFKYLPRETLVHLSKMLDIPLVQLYSIATFYKAFSLAPKGRHSLTICTGTACHVRGAVGVLEELERILCIKPGETTSDGEFSLTTVNCLGSCALGPIVVQDETGKYHPRMTATKIKPLIDGITSAK